MCILGDSVKLAILNPGGNDPERHFSDGAGKPGAPGHPPVNYHAYAACTGGAFFREVAAIGEDFEQVLLLIRRDLGSVLKALRQLKKAGRTVAVSLKESGLFQFSELLEKPERIESFHQICAEADGAISSTPELVPVYQSAGARRVAFIPTPYPVDDSRWDFSVPCKQREGIFIGTREFEIPSRQHLAALMIARQSGEKITVVNVEGRAGRKRIAALSCERLQIVEGKLPYPDYLKLMARHRVVFQLDRSAVPGQVAGDALLTRTPCVGGNGAIERLAFPEFSETDAEAALTQMRSLIADSELWQKSVEKSLEAAHRKISFSSIRESLGDFYRSLRSESL